MGRIRQDEMVSAFRYGLLTNRWTEQSRFQEVFGAWKFQDPVSGSPSLAKVMKSANEVLKTFGLKSQVTVIDVIDAAWGPRGLDTYNMMLNETYQEVAYRSGRNEDDSCTWRLIT